MITPRYTGFYKPGLTVKAATLSLWATDKDAANPQHAQEFGQEQSLRAVERAIKWDKTAKAA